MHVNVSFTTWKDGMVRTSDQAVLVYNPMLYMGGQGWRGVGCKL